MHPRTSTHAHESLHARTHQCRRARARARHAHAHSRTHRTRTRAGTHAHARVRACVCVVTELLSRFVFFLLLGAVPPVPRPLPLWAPGGVARFDPADLPDAPSADESESSPSSSTVTWISSLPCGGGQSGGGGTLAIGRDPSHDPCIGQLRATGLPGLSHDPCIGPLRAPGLPGSQSGSVQRSASGSRAARIPVTIRASVRFGIPGLTGLPGLSGRVDGAVSLFVRAKRQG